MTTAVTDFNQFSQMRVGAETNDPAALREVAGQFEALFIQSLLKNMRAAELGDPLMGNSDQHKMYQEMMDQQLALEMASGPGIGLADMLVQQLGGAAQPFQPTRESFLMAPAMAERSTATAESITARRDLTSGEADMLSNSQPSDFHVEKGRDWSTPENFVKDIWPHAERVAKRLDIAPEGIVAQAALETGWGAHVMRRDDGTSSNNLFGIKAQNGWSGGSVSRPTVEYVNGVVEQKVESFRTYSDIAKTFDDYARLIEDNPRYEAVRGSGRDLEAFGAALQDAGYATDPLYAAKIARVSQSETMREAMSGLRIQ